MTINIPQMNDMVSVTDLIELNKALRKSTEVGYQTPAVPSSGSLSPLVPQSIEGTLASATYSMKELALWPAIPKRSVTNTVHEYNVIQDHGLDIDPFIAEGQGGLSNKSTYERKHLRIKYMAERREVSDVATLVNILGSNPTAIAEETERGTLALMQKIERQLFHGDSTINALGFDGMFKQIEDGAPNNVTDKAGAKLLPADLQDILADLSSAPNFGRPDCIYVEPRVHTSLIKAAVDDGRHDQLKIAPTTGLTYGVSNISINGPMGPVAVKSAPFLFTSFEAPAAASHDLQIPVITTQPANTGTGTSKWVAGDAGDYLWKIVGVSTLGGYSAPVTTAALTIAAGMKPMIEMTQSGVDYYRVYRSAKDGLADTCKFVFEVKNDPSSTQDILDNQDVVYNASKVLVTQHDPGIFEFVRLLDFLRRPLAEIATTRPFLLMLFGAPVVKVPTKTWMMKNVAGL